MSLFDLNDFERQGQVENDVRFDNVETAKNLLADIFADTLRSVQIYTPDMEPALYNDPQLMDALLAMVRGNRHARIQILAQDTGSARHRGHALLRLAHNLTSAIDVRIPAEEYREAGLGFVVVDNRSFFYRPDVSVMNGIYNQACKVRAGKLTEIFTLIWEHAQEDVETRRLSI